MEALNVSKTSVGHRTYRRIEGVRGIPLDHNVVLFGVDKDGRMGTASGVDFEDARANVDRKLEAAKEGRQPVTEEDLSRDWPEEPVPVNELDAAALARAAGISSSLAAAVVEHRHEHGEFTSGPDLGRVSHRDREGLVKLATLADYRSGKK